MTNAIVFDPVMPWWAIGGLCALAAAISVLSLRLHPVGVLPRLIALAALVGLLANPQIRTAQERPLDDIAVIVVDRSLSQSLDSREEVTDRAAAALRARLQALGGVEMIETTVAGAEETRIGEAVRSTLSETPRSRLAGVFVITDGQSIDRIDTGALPGEAPIHVLLSGRADEVDRKITLINAPRYGIVGEAVDISFRIDDIGADGVLRNGQETATVTLRVDGAEVLRESVPTGTEVSFKAPLARPGQLVIELEAGALEGELSIRNNIAVLPVAAIRDRLRVLLISGEPHAGERVWRNLLKSDPAIDLVHFTILRPLEKQSSDGVMDPRELALIEFPQDELFIDKLREFDLLIFDRYTYRGVLNAYHFDNIARYVEGGGAVLVSAGPEFNGPLSLAARRNFSFILPVIPRDQALSAPFRPAITVTGRRHPVTRDLPDATFWGRWLRIMPADIRTGSALMNGPSDHPLLVLDRVGEGRVGVILSDHFWLWARGFDGGGPHVELLRRIAHWLMKEPDLEEERLVLRDVAGDLVVERRTLAEVTEPVQLTGPDGTTTQIVLEAAGEGAFSALIAAPARGLYRARAGDLFAIGAVGLAASPEFENVVSTTAVLAPAVTETRGGLVRVRTGEREVLLPQVRRINANMRDRAGSGWMGLVSRSATQTEAVSLRPAAPPTAWLALIGVSLALAWWLEGRAKRNPRASK